MGKRKKYPDLYAVVSAMAGYYRTWTSRGEFVNLATLADELDRRGFSFGLNDRSLAWTINRYLYDTLDVSRLDDLIKNLPNEFDTAFAYYHSIIRRDAIGVERRSRELAQFAISRSGVLTDRSETRAEPLASTIQALAGTSESRRPKRDDRVVRVVRELIDDELQAERDRFTLKERAWRDATDLFKRRVHALELEVERLRRRVSNQATELSIQSRRR